MLNNMSGMLVNKSTAANYIRSSFRNVFSFAANSKSFDYSMEPFFRGRLTKIDLSFFVVVVVEDRRFDFCVFSVPKVSSRPRTASICRG